MIQVVVQGLRIDLVSTLGQRDKQNQVTNEEEKSHNCLLDRLVLRKFLLIIIKTDEGRGIIGSFLGSFLIL